MAQNEIKKQFNEHKIIMENQSKVSITGVERVEVATPTQFVCLANRQRLQIVGKGLEVDKLDVECGCVALSGLVTTISYLGEKKSLIRRLFK